MNVIKIRRVRQISYIKENLLFKVVGSKFQDYVEITCFYTQKVKLSACLTWHSITVSRFATEPQLPFLY